jgi:phage gp36-like protein
MMDKSQLQEALDKARWCMDILDNRFEEPPEYISPALVNEPENIAARLYVKFHITKPRLLKEALNDLIQRLETLHREA